MMLNQDTLTIKELIDKSIQYVENNIELAKLKLINKGSSLTSAFLAYIIIAIFFIMLLTLVSIGAALWIGKYLGETYYGFFIIGGIFLVLIIILFSLRNKWLKLPIANSLIQNLHK